MCLISLFQTWCVFAGEYVLVWKKGVAVLTAGNVKVTPDPRISLVNGNNLQILDLTPQDAGVYTCQIGTLIPKELSHTLEVLGKNHNKKLNPVSTDPQNNSPFFSDYQAMLENRAN